jgi:hypothetical protein
MKIHSGEIPFHHRDPLEGIKEGIKTEHNRAPRGTTKTLGSVDDPGWVPGRLVALSGGFAPVNALE